MHKVYSTTPNDLPHKADHLAKLFGVLAARPQHCAKIADFLKKEPNSLSPAYVLWDDNGIVGVMTIEIGDASENVLLLKDDKSVENFGIHRSTGAHGAFVEFQRKVLWPEPPEETLREIQAELDWLLSKGFEPFIRSACGEVVDFGFERRTDCSLSAYAQKRAKALSDAFYSDPSIRSAITKLHNQYERCPCHDRQDASDIPF